MAPSFHHWAEGPECAEDHARPPKGPCGIQLEYRQDSAGGTTRPGPAGQGGFRYLHGGLGELVWLILMMRELVNSKLHKAELGFIK